MFVSMALSASTAQPQDCTKANWLWLKTYTHGFTHRHTQSYCIPTECLYRTPTHTHTHSCFFRSFFFFLPLLTLVVTLTFVPVCLYIYVKLEVVEIALDQCGPSTERKIALIDKNHDLYLTCVRHIEREPKVCKIGKNERRDIEPSL